MKSIVAESYNYEVWHHTGIAKYKGCTCSNDDCNCCFNDRLEYDYYTVKKTRGKIRTTKHANLEEVEKRIKQIQS